MHASLPRTHAPFKKDVYFIGKKFRMFQGDKLTMMGLGSDGSEPLFDAGIHLRWHFQTALNFPRFGFDLYRRPHVDMPFSCLDMRKLRWTSSPTLRISPVGRPASGLLPRKLATRYSASTGAVSLTSTAAFAFKPGKRAAPAAAMVAQDSGTLTLTTATAWVAFRLNVVNGHSDTIVRAYDGRSLVAETTHPASASAGTILIRADRFDKIVLAWKGRIGIHDICWAFLPKDERPDLTWSHLGNFKLPGAEATALGRIAYPAPHSGKDYAAAWKQMQEVVAMVPHGPQTATATSGNKPRPQYTVKPVDTLCLMGLVDTGLARMIGLYYIDTKADPSVAYDYMIVGRWTEKTVGNERWVCYGLQMGRPSPVPEPTGLVAQAKKWIGAAATTQTACALKWKLLDETRTVAAKRPVFFNVYRAARSGGAWRADSKVNKERPVLISTSGGVLPASFYIDGPLVDGEYRYAVTGVDLFGRESALSAHAAITLADLVAPPPPTDVKAALDNDSYKTAVQWQWPAHRRQIAGDAVAFRVYHQIENVRPQETTLVTVTDHGATSECVTDLKASEDWRHFIDGWLMNRGHRFKVKSLSVSGSDVIMTVWNTADKEGNKIIPSAQHASGYSGFLRYTPMPGALFGRATLTVDWSDPSKWDASYVSVPIGAGEAYAATVPAMTLSTSVADPVAYALIGVGTVDATGNVGPVSIPAMVSARHDEAPATPSAPTGDLYATRADINGRSRYSLTFATTVGLYYDIVCTTDAALVFAAHGREYKAWEVDDADLAALAVDGACEKTFVSIGPKNADGSALAGTGATLSHTDTFPGTGRNRYVYRLVAYDKAGNRSAMSSPLLVKLHDVTPPKTPLLTKVSGGDRQITLQWARNREFDFSAYRLYRTDSEEEAKDIRSMTLVTEIAGDGDPAYTDDVTGLVDYWYRLTAVDVSGNESAPTAARKCRAYDYGTPDEPTWVRAEWVKIDGDGNEYAYADATAGLTNAVALEFAVAQAEVKALAQRKDDEGDWENITTWSSGTEARSFVLYDAAAMSDGENTYRIKLMSSAGLTLESAVDRTVVAPT